MSHEKKLNFNCHSAFYDEMPHSVAFIRVYTSFQLPFVDFQSKRSKYPLSFADKNGGHLKSHEQS